MDKKNIYEINLFLKYIIIQKFGNNLFVTIKTYIIKYIYMTTKY